MNLHVFEARLARRRRGGNGLYLFDAPPKRKPRSNNSFNKNKQYHAAYRAKVAAWRRPNGDVAVSAVSTTTQETGAVGSPTTAATSPPLQRVGSGPLAMWLP